MAVWMAGLDGSLAFHFVYWPLLFTIKLTLTGLLADNPILCLSIRITVVLQDQTNMFENVWAGLCTGFNQYMRRIPKRITVMFVRSLCLHKKYAQDFYAYDCHTDRNKNFIYKTILILTIIFFLNFYISYTDWLFWAEKPLSQNSHALSHLLAARELDWEDPIPSGSPLQSLNC